MPSEPPDSMVRIRRIRTRIEVSEPTYVDGRWCCTGKLLGAKFDHLPWLGSGERPEDLDEDLPTATLFLVAGVGNSAEEARKQVLAKIRNVWGSKSHPPPQPRIEAVDSADGSSPSANTQDPSLVTRLFRFLRRAAS